MNTVNLIGNMTADPELKTTANGVMMTQFTVAVPKRRGENGADFVRCTAFSKTAELITQYVKKGNRIGIVGRLDVSQFQDADGNKRSTTKVVVDHIDFLERRENTEQTAAQPEMTIQTPALETIDDDDNLPF